MANCASPSHIDLSKDDDDCLEVPIHSVEGIQDATKDATTDERKSRWKWNEEKVESLVMCLHDYKIKKDYEGKYMEVDLVKLYEDIISIRSKNPVNFRLPYFP